MEPRATFKFFRSFYTAACALPDEKDQAQFLLAICAYALDGIQPEVSGVPKAMFELVKPNIDASIQKSESGARGGLSGKQTASTSEANEKQTPSKSEAERKQTASTSEANEKQTPSKSEAERKQTVSTLEAKKEEGSRKKEEGSRKKDVGGGESARTRTKCSKSDSSKHRYAEHVSMSIENYETLLKRFGAEDTARLIEILDNYKGATGKEYQDDYRAILSWCVDKLTETRQKEQRNNQRLSTSPVPDKYRVNDRNYDEGWD